MNTANARPDSRRRLTPALLVLTALLAVIPAGAQGAAGERLRLVLDDATIDVIGPVERDGALLTFRTLEGRLGSIQVRRVARVLTLATGRSTPPPAAATPRTPAASSSPLPPGRAGSFSNDDLPGEAPDTARGAITNTDLTDDADTPVVTRGTAWTNADLPPGASPEPTPGDTTTDDGTAAVPDRTALDDAIERLDRTDAISPAPVAPPAEPAGVAVDTAPAPDRFALEAELAAIDEQIATAEREENTFYRLMVCVQHGISPRSPACTPRLRPKPSAFPSASERSLAARLADARERVESGTAAREVLVERARADGVALELPTAP